ncbi:MAG: GAF domain-containing protein, partial [Actinobacteria bacterium]|nr:GAF domain-containing protein [Actinomycetota bacterium]
MTATAESIADVQLVEVEASPYRSAMLAMAEIGSRMGDDRMDLDDLLRKIGKQACRLVGATRCSVYLRDPESAFYQGRVGHGERDIDARIKALKAGTLADRFTHEIVATKAPVIITDALHDPRPVKATMREWNVRSMLGVPMLS